MFSTLLQLLMINHDQFNFFENEELNEKIKKLNDKFEELKKSFDGNVEIDKLLSTQNDVNGLETAKKLDNILMLGIRIGMELGVSLPDVKFI